MASYRVAHLPPTALVVAICLIAGCPKAPELDEEAALTQALRRVDAAWASRGSRGFEGVDAALDAVPARFRELPQVRWRRVRLLTGRGLAQEEAWTARRWYAEARAESLGCLGQVAGVQLRLEDENLAAALVEVPPSHAPCAAWGGFAWSRFLVTFDDAAATLDVPDVRAMLRVGRRGDRELDDLITWGEALVDEVAVSSETVPEARRERKARADLGLERVLGKAGDLAWVAWADAVRWLEPPPEGKRPRRPPRTPEERVAHARLAQGGGPASP